MIVLLSVTLRKRDRYLVDVTGSHCCRWRRIVAMARLAFNAFFWPAWLPRSRSSRTVEKVLQFRQSRLKYEEYNWDFGVYRRRNLCA
jgi:hypothetical protein